MAVRFLDVDLSVRKLQILTKYILGRECVKLSSFENYNLLYLSPLEFPSNLLRLSIWNETLCITEKSLLSEIEEFSTHLECTDGFHKSLEESGFSDLLFAGAF